MKLHVIATRDIKTDAFGNLVTTPHVGSAIRAFADSCQGKIQNGDPTLAMHPEDFELYQLGWYDDTTGELSNEKIQIAVGSNYKGNGNAGA